MTNRLMFAMVSAMVVLSAEPASGGETLRVDGTEFVYRVPQSYGTNAQIMVLFGGRNWPGDKTLKTFHFDELADRHGVFLLSPSFHDRDYWEPEAWSGETLKSAVRNIETKHSLTPSKLYLYGYSAGGAVRRVVPGLHAGARRRLGRPCLRRLSVGRHECVRPGACHLRTERRGTRRH